MRARINPIIPINTGQVQTEIHLQKVGYQPASQPNLVSDWRMVSVKITPDAGTRQMNPNKPRVSRPVVTEAVIGWSLLQS